jgi:hypothetical protein
MSLRARAHQLSLAAFTLAVLAGCDEGKQRLGWTFDPGPDESSLPGDTFVPWAGGPAYYRKWANGPSAEPDYFPISVWLQNPTNVDRYAEVGVNNFTGLWNGPTDEQLGMLGTAGTSTYCEQTLVWKQHLDDRTITAWMQPDGPDNAQENAAGGYDPCVDPAKVVAIYDELRANDPTRPVYLGLGRGVADPEWVGRGTCTGRTDMYPAYTEGGDLLSFHLYPHNDGKPIEMVGAGVANLVGWAGARKAVIPTIEASDINGGARPSPAEIQAEVWMSLIHGAMGIQYFCHRIAQPFSETDCLDDAPTAAALKAINTRIHELAPVLNVPSVANGVQVASSAADIPVDVMLKRHGRATYLFAVEMRAGKTTATFTLRGIPATATIEVLGEDRRPELTAADGGASFSDAFSDYGVHLYRVGY